jgi:uncharacterized protein YbjT (DUF2867 family)
MARICIVGGSGFIGRHLAESLVRAQHVIVIPTRNRERAKRDLIMLPTVDLLRADIHDDAELERLLARCDAVINLVGVLNSKGGRPYGPQFARAHVELPRRIVEACRRQGVPRLVHISALGASESAPSEYLRSKAAGEEAVLQAAGLHATVFRPSVVFGPGDRFLNLFATLQRFVPVVFLGMAEARFQPVFVGDVARAVTACLDEDKSFGEVYELAGPRVYTLRQLVRYAGELCGHPRAIIGLGGPLSIMQAFFLEWLPLKLLTRDNVRSMRVPSVSSAVLPFGIQPTPIEAVAPGYLGKDHLQSRFDRFRTVVTRR